MKAATREWLQSRKQELDRAGAGGSRSDRVRGGSRSSPGQPRPGDEIKTTGFEERSETDYWKAFVVRRQLQRFDNACRKTGRGSLSLDLQVCRSRAMGRAPHMFEDAVNLAVDVEGMLRDLNDFERLVLGWIGVRGYSERQTARMLRCDVFNVSRSYWSAVQELYARLLAGGYIDGVAAEIAATDQQQL